MLIGYASRFGSTRDIAMRIADTVRRHGHDVDVRSVEEIRREIESVRAVSKEDPNLISDLARLATDPDWLVSMRAMDLLEKIAQQHADWVQPHKRLFIGPLADSVQWEIRLQVVRALPLRMLLAPCLTPVAS